jgi:hypothetical protein
MLNIREELNKIENRASINKVNDTKAKNALEITHKTKNPLAGMIESEKNTEDRNTI